MTSSRTTPQSVINIVSSSYKYVKTQYRILLKNPSNSFKIITTFLAFQISLPNFVGAAKDTRSLARLNQCPILVYNTFSLLFSTPEDELQKDFRIIQNTQTLSEVRDYLFAENHANQTHRQLERYYISSLGRLGEDVRFEGLPANITFPCASMCVDPDTNNFIKISNPRKGMTNEALCKTANLKPFITNPLLTCRGWDSPNIKDIIEDYDRNYTVMVLKIGSWNKLYSTVFDEIDHFKETYTSLPLDEIALKVQKIFYEGKTVLASHIPDFMKGEFVDNIKNVTDLVTKLEKGKKQKYSTKQINSILDVFTEFENNFTNIHNKTLTVLNNAAKLKDDIIVIKRNQEAIKSMPPLEKHAGRNYWLFGKTHLISTRANKQEIGEIHRDDLPFELRSHLQNRPHAILVPI